MSFNFVSVLALISAAVGVVGGAAQSHLIACCGLLGMFIALLVAIAISWRDKGGD